MGNKKVSVSATPGHTKHFQVFISKHWPLCRRLSQFFPLGIFWMPFMCSSFPSSAVGPHKPLTCLSDSLCGTWPLLMWLPRPGDAILRLYKGGDDLQWNPPNRPDEGSRSTCITNILSALRTPRLLCVNWGFGFILDIASHLMCLGLVSENGKSEILTSALPRFTQWDSSRTSEWEPYVLATQGSLVEMEDPRLGSQPLTANLFDPDTAVLLSDLGKLA